MKPPFNPSNLLQSLSNWALEELVYIYSRLHSRNDFHGCEGLLFCTNMAMDKNICNLYISNVLSPAIDAQGLL